MSDPVEKEGSDEVLASIRRLVSKFHEPQLRTITSKPAPERFVLTPDLRVIDGDKGAAAPMAADSAPTLSEPTPFASEMDAGGEMSLEERISELETAVGNQADDWETDGDEDLTDDALQSFPRSFVARNSHRAGALDGGAERGQSAPLTQAGVLDDDALRDMVADIIRDELKGVMGERITGNIRRLVRREVMRSLALREFD